ncbi:hypothetical protein [Methylobacterium nigriterrae]
MSTQAGSAATQRAGAVMTLLALLAAGNFVVAASFSIVALAAD